MVVAQDLHFLLLYSEFIGHYTIFGNVVIIKYSMIPGHCPILCQFCSCLLNCFLQLFKWGILLTVPSFFFEIASRRIFQRLFYLLIVYNSLTFVDYIDDKLINLPVVCGLCLLLATWFTTLFGLLLVWFATC